MTEKIIKYKADGRDYDVYESEVSKFLETYPNATIRASVGDRNYDVFPSEMEDFLKTYPNASYTLDSPLSTVVDTNYEPTLPESEEDAPEMSRRERRQARREERREARRNDDNTSIWETIGKGTGAAAVGTAKLALDLGRMAWRNSVLGRFAGGDFDDALQDESNPLTRASIKLGEVQERLSREADPTGGEKGFLDLLSAGKVGKAFQKALGSGIESLPMMAAAGTGIGAFLYGAAMAAGSYADETRENPDIPAWKRGINSAGSAVLEMAVEKIGGPLKNLGGKAGKEVTEEVAQEILRKVAKEGPETIGKRILRGLGKVGKQSIEEGGEEFLTSFGNDALGEALDLIDGDKDYGIRAQWEQVKSENPDADAWDFALAKGKEYVDSFLGGAMSGLEISGVEQLSSGGLRLNAERKARKMFDDARSLGSSLDYGDMYDSDDTVREQIDAVAATFTNEKGEAGISNEFIGALSSEDAFALSRRENFSPEQRNALFGLARAKAIQEGLTAKLDEGVESLVSEERMRIEGAIENGSVITAEYNGKQVYVKGAANVGDGTVTAPGGQNGPVVIIDANTGEQSIVRSEEVQFAESHNPDEYARDIENAIRSNDARTREIARNTMSVRAKAKAVKPFAGKKILVDVGNGLAEVLVQQISPNGDVIIKGKKGDLGGQSIMTLSAGAFYDSIYRDEDGNPVITEAPKEAEAETPQEEAPIAEVTGDEDYRGQTISILLNGVPTEVEVMSQDNPSDLIVYEYTDASGNRRTASSTIGAFNAAIQQAAEYVAPTPTAEETPSVETVPADSETQAPQEVPVTPENIDWDALFEQDPEAYFVELQNQFGEEALDILNDEVVAAQEELDSLSKKRGKTQNERLENRQKKVALQNRIAALNGMIARLAPAAAPIEETPVTPETAEMPVVETPATETPAEAVPAEQPTTPSETAPAVAETAPVTETPAVPESTEPASVEQTPVAETPAETVTEPEPTPVTTESAPVAPNPVDNPAREAQKREKALAQQLQRYGISPEQKADMAFNAGKAVGDFFATREEYDAYAENATDLGDYNADFERGVDASFANRQQNVGNSPVNSVPLETEPNGENNGEEGTSQGTIREGQAGVPGSEQTYDEGAEEGASSPQAVRGSGADNSGLIEDRYPARKGDITRQELTEAFGLNYVSPAINQEVLNSVYDFMMEMSKMLGISPKSIGHGATLSVKTLKDNSRARAQYSFSERIDGTIVDAYLNFKNSKLSSIAHEWFHSLDQALSYYETGKGRRSATNAIAGEFAGRKETLDAIKGILNAINKSGHKERLKKELWFNKSFLRYSLRKNEMTARAFEEYIRMKFAEAGIEVEGLSENATNHPTPDEMAVIAPAFDNLFKVLQEKEGKIPGTSVLYHIGEIMEEESDARQLATEAVLTALDDNGIDVVRATDEQTQQMLDVAAEVAEMQKGTAPETASVQEEHHPTVVSSADGAKVLKDLDSAIQEVNAPELLQTPNGTVYGWTDGKKIYLTEAGINPNTPIHEYTHLWAKAMMQKNPKGWNNIKKLLKGTPVWNEVMSDPNYSSIHNDEDAVASEALSRISGKENAAKMEQMAQKMIDEAKGTARKLEARGLVQNMREALNRFWEFVWKDLFKMGRFISVEHVTDRILFDLLNGTDLGVMSEGQVQTQIVTDPDVIAELEASPKRTGYRNVVQNEDGTFSSPMAYWLQGTKEGAKSRVETAKFELGKWEEAEEHPELVDEKGHVVLVKPNKSTVEVAYDPYINNRLDPVNLQFKDAWKRDELVYVETVVPVTDLESGYHADQALLPVGVHSWSNGDVMLSKYDKPVRIMPWEAVADAWVERLNGNGVHFDVVPPALRSLLVERGVEILPPHKGMGKDCNDAYEALKKENEITLSRKGKINANFVEQFEFKQNNERQELEYSDEFRRLQEESARMHERDVAEYHRGKRRDSGSVRQRLGGAFRRELARRNIGGGNKILSHVNKSKGTSFDIIENVDGRLFHDIFAIVRNYLPNGELVDLHDNYNDAICYITTDGLAGFAVDKDGNLISVYSLYGGSKRGFLGAIKNLITEAGATHLDGYNSRLQPLAEIYSKVFGWKVASMMDYNMEYDHDNIAENHGMPQVAFMVNTDADIETRHFDKDQYDDAVAYQLEQVAKSKENSLSSQSYEGTGDAYADNDGRGMPQEGTGVPGEVPVSGPLSEGRRLARPENGKVSQDGIAGFNPISKREGESDRQRNNREAKFLSFVNNLTSSEQVNLYGFLKDYINSPSGILRGRANDFINSIRQKGNNSFSDFVDDFINDELKYREGVSSAEVAKHGLLVGVNQDLNAIERIFYAFNKDHYNGVLFDRVLKLAKRFGVSVKFETRNADGGFIASYGSYNQNDNSITLDANLLVKGNESELCQTIVHELIHSVVARAASIMTGRAVDKNNQFIDPQSLPKDVVDGINTLKEVYEAIKDDGTFQDTYGKKDFEEMLSEITDPKFRGLLKAKKLWKKFLNGICKILGIADESSSESDALTEIESALDNILSAAERGELDSAYASYLGQLADGYTLADLQRLGSGPVKTLLTQNVLFRTGIDVDTMATETAKEVYGRAVKARWQEFQRQFQDAMQPVRIAIDAIQQETGNIPIEDYENYLLIKNQASSRSRVEIDNFQRRYFSPVVKQVNKIIDQIMESRGWKVKDESKRADVYAEVKQYLIAKHGLERNELYQTTKTRNLNIGERTREINNAQKIYDDNVNQINLDASLTDAERQLQLREALDAYNATLEEIRTRQVPDVRDYSGLTALFGLEAKEYVEAERLAQELVDNFENEVSTDELWAKINAATNKTLRHSYKCGLLSRSQYEQIRDMFEFYIPLRGFDETTAEDVYSYLRFESNSFSPAVKEAKGRTSIADDPLAYIMTMAESEITQGNNNRAKQALYNFILNRASATGKQNTLMQVEDVWYVKSVDANGKVSQQIAAPNHAAGETYEEFEVRMTALEAAGNAFKSKKGQVDVGMRFQVKRNQDAHYVYLKVNGVEKAIYINGDPKAADAINGRYAEKPGRIEEKMREANRLISSTFTNYSLEFTLRNFTRDMIYANINLAIKEPDPAYRRKFRRNWAHNNMGTMIKMLQAYRAGEFEGRTDLNEDEAAFVEFMENGGQTGYTLINSVESRKKDLERAIKRMQNGIDKGGVKDSTVFRYTLGGIELLNEASELVTRFAAFKTSRDMGRSILRSVSDAKEITVNFNTKGAQDGKGWMGMLAKWFGATRFFFNASVQGIQNVKAMANANKFKFGGVVAGLVASGFLMPILQGMLIELLGGDDDWYWDIPEYDRQSGICIVIGDGKYVKIPLPVGLNKMYAIGDTVASWVFDKKHHHTIADVGMEVANLVASTILPVNPLEGTVNELSLMQSVVNAVAPSSTQAVIQNLTNTDWKGAPIQKEYTYNRNDPQWEKAYSSNPAVLKALSKWCYENVKLDSWFRGWDWSPEYLDNTLSNLGGGIYSLIKKTGNAISMIWNEDARELSKVPLVGVFFGTTDDRFGYVNEAYYDLDEEFNSEVNPIKKTAKAFGYSLDEVFKPVAKGGKRVGDNQPKMQKDVYGNRHFEHMQAWYLGQKKLDSINDEIEKQEKKMAKMENPPQGEIDKMAKLQAEYETTRTELVNGMLESKYEQIIDKFRK